MILFWLLNHASMGSSFFSVEKIAEVEVAVDTTAMVTGHTTHWTEWMDGWTDCAYCVYLVSIPLVQYKPSTKRQSHKEKISHTSRGDNS